MIDTSTNQIEARTGFFVRRVTCRLTGEHVEIKGGPQTTRIRYGDLVSIRIARQGARRTVIEFCTTGGQKIQLRLAPRSASDQTAQGFIRSLVSRIAKVAPETPLHLGPSRRQRVAAWIGLVASVAILTGADWSLVTDGSIGPLLLPIGIALANLGVIIPILQAGSPRHCVVSAAPATLV
jgi:hypothetical protein